MAHLLLYDGVCGLCNRLTQFLLTHDRHDRFRFAALQGPLAAEVLAKYGRDPRDLDTVYLVADHGLPSEQLLDRGRAIRFALAQLGGPFVLARALWFIPCRCSTSPTGKSQEPLRLVRQARRLPRPHPARQSEVSRRRVSDQPLNVPPLYPNCTDRRVMPPNQ